MARYTGPKTKISRIFGEPILGNGKWLITCQNNASTCTRRAKKICSSGYEVASMNRSQGFSGSASEHGGGFGTQRDYSMEVQCK